MTSGYAAKNPPPATKPAKRDLYDESPPEAFLNAASDLPPMDAIDVDKEDSALRSAAALSREEVLRRRLRRLKTLRRYYIDQYWALMEEVRVRYRDYYWEFGKSPFEGDEAEDGASAVSGTTGKGGEEGKRGGAGPGGLGFGKREGGEKAEREKCAISGCKTYAMPLTRFCHPHILLDPRQTLYKPCTYVTKSAPNGQTICGKPVLRAAVPSLCPTHFHKAQRHVSQALRKAGLNVSSSNRPAPKFHLIVAEYVRQIQARRREARKARIASALTIRDKDGK